MITVNDVHNWVELGLGEVIEYPAERPRPVTLDVNTSGEAVIMIQLANEKAPRLLALVKGRETIKFAVPCAYQIMHKSPESDVYVLTADGSKVHREAMGEEAFTTLHERRPRDPNLEYMMYTMEQNFQRRMKIQEAQIERRYQAVSGGTSDKGEDAGGGKQTPDPAGSKPGDDSGAPQPDGGKAGS